jgi:hypothetical protein
MATPEFTDFKLPSGATVHVQSSLKPATHDGGWRSGVGEASGVAGSAREAWGDGMALVREVAAGVVAGLYEATKGAERVTVEFGVAISGKAGVVVVESNTAANLKVTITWAGKT